MDDKHKKVGIGILLGSIAASAYGLDPDTFTKFISEAAASEIAKAGFFFTVAAWIHSGRVRKEIKNSFSLVTDAINNVAAALRHDLQLQNDRLEKVESAMIDVNKRVERLEKP